MQQTPVLNVEMFFLNWPKRLFVNNYEVFFPLANWVLQTAKYGINNTKFIHRQLHINW